LKTKTPLVRVDEQAAFSLLYEYEKEYESAIDFGQIGLETMDEILPILLVVNELGELRAVILRQQFLKWFLIKFCTLL